MVDLDKYPLLYEDSDQYQGLVDHHRRDLASRGVTTLPGLVTQQAINQAVKVITIMMTSCLSRFPLVVRRWR